MKTWCAFSKFILAVAASVTLAACGSSGGGGGAGGVVTGLELASGMSVVNPQDAPGGIHINYGGAAGVLSTQLGSFSSGSDYNADTTRTFVWDDSMESFSTVNMILCMMDQTKASDMVNQGAYTALVNEAKCEQGKNQSGASNGGNSSNTQNTQLKKWTVISTRADNSSPQIVKVWIPGKANASDPGEAQSILAEITVTEGVSPNKPYGAFSMNFRGYVDSGVIGQAPGTTLQMMSGALRTVTNQSGKPQFEFVNLSGAAQPGMSGAPFSRTEKSSVLLDDNTSTSGVARAFMDESNGSGSRHAEYDIAFNSTRFLRQKDDGQGNTVQACTARDQFVTQIWNYNLYHETAGTFKGNSVTAGQRVELNSGFPFEYQNKNGHIGYWGIWTEDPNSNITDGTTIYKVNYSDNSRVAHTVNISDGKLKRRTVNVEQLTKMRGEAFFSWRVHPTLGYPGNGNSFNSWKVIVDSNNDFVITAGVTWGSNGPTFDESVVDATITPGSNGEQLWLWSDGHGGNFVYSHDSAVAAGSRTVKFYAEDNVQPNESMATSGTTLYCYDRCPRGGVTTPANEAALYYPSYETATTDDAINDGPSEGGLRTYTLQATGGKMTLTDDTNGQVVNVTDSSGLNQWGVDSGDMVSTQLSDVRHPNVNPGGTNSPYEVYNLNAGDTSYRWETGANNWNRTLTATRGSDSQLIVFDMPIKLPYTAAAADDVNGDPYGKDGKQFMLEYGGKGQLWGFPHEQDQSGRWYSAINLKDGTVLSAGGDSFVVKAIEKEQKMAVLGDLSTCSALNVGAASALSFMSANDIGSISFTINDKPTVTAAPAVVDGELQ